MGAIAEIPQQHRQIEARHEAAELDAARAQTLAELEEIFLVILRRVDVLGTGVRHQSHQQVEMGRRRPGSVRPPLLHFPQLAYSSRARAHERIVPAAIKYDEDVVVADATSRVASCGHLSASLAWRLLHLLSWPIHTQP